MSSTYEPQSEDGTRVLQPEHAEDVQVSCDIPRIDKHIHAMYAAQELEQLYPRLSFNDPGCDTAIIIDPPPREPEFSEELYEVICRHFDRVFPAKSSILKRFSPSYLAPMFEPARQKRLFGKLGRKLLGPAETRPKYVLDLTPPEEGEEAVITVTDLHCPMTVRLWHLSKLRFKCPEQLVGSNEEFSKYNKVRLELGLDLEEDAITGAAPAYVKLRHHRAIERLIMNLHNREVDTDSAVKIYTTAGVSHHLGIVNPPFADIVTSWIYHQQNKFLQLAPEACLQLADWLQLTYVARDAFAILVGERALDRAAGNTSQTLTWHKRKRAELDEAWQTRIQYAQESFEQRVGVCFESLVDQDMQWVEQLPEAQKLVRLRDDISRPAAMEPVRNAAQEVLLHLKSMVRFSIFAILCADMVWMEQDDVGGIVGAENLHSRASVATAHNELSWKSRIFTAVFWRMLSSTRPSDVLTDPVNGSGQRTFGCGIACMRTYTSQSHARLVDAGFEQDCNRKWFHELREKVDNLTQQIARNRRPAGIQQAHEQLTIRLRSNSSSQSPPYELVSADTLSMRVPAFPSVLPVRSQPPIEKVVWASLPPSMFSEKEFLKEVEQGLSSRAAPMLWCPLSSPEIERDYTLTNFLICLEEDETTCLPLWAGGNDDGSGGVFSSTVIASDEKFNSASLMGGSVGHEFDMMSFTNSEVPTSVMVQDGYSDTLERRRVYAASEAESTDTFELVQSVDATQSEDDIMSVNSDTPTVVDATDDYTDIFMNSDDSDTDEQDDSDD